MASGRRTSSILTALDQLMEQILSDGKPVPSSTAPLRINPYIDRPGMNTAELLLFFADRLRA